MDVIDRIKTMRKEAKSQGNPVLRDESFDLLIETVKEKRPERILEIGVNTGLSGIAMLLVSPSATLTGIEIDEDAKNTAESNYTQFGVNNRTRIILGDANEVVPLLSGSYDFIFLDGPKGHYYQYLPYLLDLLTVGGTIFADNILFRGYVDGRVKAPRKYSTIKNSMRNYLKEVTTNPDLKTAVYRIEDGVSITTKIK